MKKILYSFILFCSCSFAFSQSSVDVITGATYANDAYYSFTEGTVATSPRYNWDIAFAAARMNISILANNGCTVELYTYPNGNISAWESIDTNGLSTWPKMYNSIEDINGGAFVQNAIPGDLFDYGWGKYNMANHHIVGDSLFIIKTTNGMYKKLWIVEKDPNVTANTWHFKYADLDGGNEQDVSIEANSYSGKNYIHYSLEQNQIIDKEPASENWDLRFTKYYDYTIPYYVTGVLANTTRVKVQEVNDVNQASYEDYDDNLMTENMSAIGYDWKTFNMGTMQYSIDTNRVYFLKRHQNNGADSTYWKIYFTGFGGSANGTYSFVQKLLSDTLALPSYHKMKVLDIFPNPATDMVNIVYENEEEAQLYIMDMNGVILYESTLDKHGFQTKKINIRHLQSGVYYILLKNKNFYARNKLIKL